LYRIIILLQGFFMYADSSGARLLSLRFIPEGVHCLQLFYINAHQPPHNGDTKSSLILSATNLLEHPFSICYDCTTFADHWTRFSV